MVIGLMDAFSCWSTYGQTACKNAIFATNPVIRAFMKLIQQCWWLHKGSLSMQLDVIVTMMCSEVVHLR